MQLLMKALLRAIPPLYSQEYEEDPTCYAKFFLPDGAFTWYVIEGSADKKADNGCTGRSILLPLAEYDPDRGDDVLFFGYVVGQEDELGHFTLSELTAIRGLFDLPVERDRHFTPCPLSVVKATVEKATEWTEAELD